MRRGVSCAACRRRAKLPVFYKEKTRDRASRADGPAARATRPEPLQAAPLACLLDAAVESLKRRLRAVQGRSGALGGCRGKQGSEKEADPPASGPPPGRAGSR